MSIVAGSASFDMFGRLFTDIAGVDRILPNKVNLRIKLYRSKNSFCLMAAQNSTFEVILEEVTLYARKIDISPDLGLQLNSYMLSSTAKLPLTRVELRLHTIPQRVTSYNIDNLFLGSVPKGIVIGFLSNTAMNIL